MSRAGLARLWQILGAILAVYATGTWIVSQGGKSLADLPGLEVKSPVTSAYLAIPIIGVLSGLVAVIGLVFMRTDADEREELFPIVAVGDLGPHTMRSMSMVVFQGVFVVLFLIVPAASLYHLNTVVLQRGILWHEGDPSLGSIVLKNAYGATMGSGPRDEVEHACTDRVLRTDGFTWLANMRCDLVKNAQIGPFGKTKTTLQGEAEASADKTCVRDLALHQSTRQTCDRSRDLSEDCEGNERRCRGIQWLPSVSPLLLALPTIFGWAMTAWLLIEASVRKISVRRNLRGSD